jgi:chorismate mutase
LQHWFIDFICKGKFVAEAKFLDPKLQPKYIEYIKNRDVKAIENLLTDKRVEEALLKRLRRKALIYGQDISEHGEINLDNIQTTKQLKINVDVVVELYEKWVIPLTKEVEIEYLLARLDEWNFVNFIDFDGKNFDLTKKCHFYLFCDHYLN